MVRLTLILMQRGGYDTVTHLPILVPATHVKEEGFAIFRHDGAVRPVRTLGNEDLKDVRNAMKPHEAKHFYAVVLLGKALGANPDSLALKKGIRLVGEAYALKLKQNESSETTGRYFPPFPPSDNPDEERKAFADAMVNLAAVPPGQPAKALANKSQESRLTGDARWLLSRELSMALQDVRLVLWWSGKIFKPAILCPSLKTAFYTGALLRMSS